MHNSFHWYGRRRLNMVAIKSAGGLFPRLSIFPHKLAIAYTCVTNYAFKRSEQNKTF